MLSAHLIKDMEYGLEEKYLNWSTGINDQQISGNVNANNENILIYI